MNGSAPTAVAALLAVLSASVAVPVLANANALVASTPDDETSDFGPGVLGDIAEAPAGLVADQTTYEKREAQFTTALPDQRAQVAIRTAMAQIGLPYDELYCAHDKVGHCLNLGIELLIDDSPENLARAIDNGITVATISHPWNRDLCETEDVVCASDWTDLATFLAPVLRRARAAS